MAILLRCAIILFAGASWAANVQPNAFGPVTEYDYRPFGSNRPCSALVNETMVQSSVQIILERLLATADTMSNSFSSSLSSFTPQDHQQLHTWANQVCGQMQNAVGYLKAVCQYSASNNSPNEIAAQLKLRAMSVSRDYLCNNDAVNLKEIAINNGAQCVRRTNLVDFGCNNLPKSPSPGPLGVDPTVRFATAIILSVPSYNSETCRYANDVTNCILEKYGRSPDFCNPRVTSHMSRIVSLMLQAVQCTSGSSYPSYNGPSYGNQPAYPNYNNFNGNNNQQSGGFNNPSNEQPYNPSYSGGFANSNNQFQSGRFPQQDNNNNYPQTYNEGNFLASERRTTTVPPWSGNRRSNNAPSSRAVQIIVVVMAMVSYITC